MHHHKDHNKEGKGQKSQKDLKHYHHMISNLEKAIQSSENMEKHLIEEKTSDDPAVKDHIKAHNRIIHKIKKHKEAIKKEVQGEILELFKYGFDRTPQNVWRNVFDNKLKKFRAHRFEKQIRDCVFAIKQANEFSCLIKNAFKNMKEADVTKIIMKMEEKLSFYQKFIDDLIPFPLRNLDKSQCKDEIVGAAYRNKILEVRSVYETINQQFQKLKPFANANMVQTFSAALSSRLISPIDNLINKSKNSGEDGSKMAEVKMVIQNLADYRLDKINDYNKLFDNKMMEDIKKIKRQLEISSKKGFQIYRKINTATSKYVKKSNQLKPNDKASVYILQLEKHIESIIGFCDKVAALPIIRENQTLQKYVSMKNNYSAFDIFLQILKDSFGNNPESQASNSIQRLSKFATALYALIILKRQNFYEKIPLDRLLAQCQNIVAQVKRIVIIKEKNQENNRKINTLENQLWSKNERHQNELNEWKRTSESEIRKLNGTIQILQFRCKTDSISYDELARASKILKKELEEKDQIIQNKSKLFEQISIYYLRQIENIKESNIRQINSIKQNNFQQIETLKQAHSKQLEKLQLLNKQQVQEVLEIILFIQKIKESLKKKLQDDPDIKEIQDYLNQMPENSVKVQAERIMSEHQLMYAFIQKFVSQLTDKLKKIPYNENNLSEVDFTNLHVAIAIIHQKVGFIFDVFQIFVSFMKKTKLWNENADLARMISKDAEQYQKRILQMWKNDLKQCAKLNMNRCAILDEEQTGEFISSELMEH